MQKWPFNLWNKDVHEVIYRQMILLDSPFSMKIYQAKSGKGFLNVQSS